MTAVPARGQIDERPARHECALWPADPSHVRLLFEWRNQPRMRDAALDDHEIRWDEHLAWWDGVLRRADRHVLIYVQRGVPAGRVQLDVAGDAAVWGFQIGDLSAPRGSGARMGFLALEHAFDALGLARVDAQVIARNEPSVRYHERLGFELQAGGDVLAYALTTARWRARRVELATRYFGMGS
jgi:UDP-4-amino-4,6-dideoxy-N-acetyl-beta-L-altrosamine N-acetyltransferase